MLNLITLSCFIKRNIFNSLRVLFANNLWLNVFSIFLIATGLLVSLSIAYITHPYAPYPTKNLILN